ncbi:MAG: hypothetical protein J0J10_26210 [Bosea sp.]|uniref:hypothetical protein n=1 Tax=Bosea sp. (in: a-proteobacteria) TaxID=1871050 RepID=UPI001AD2291E|nr:hypothetical protein [Bosea sp. (in: a-proteobacteria)]MBN9472260.1 hypothetical protein [Bosea sp. (in: a-proteobacteria)]
MKISVAATQDGKVQFIAEPVGAPILDVIFPATDISAICALLLGAARTASANVGADQPIQPGANEYQGYILPTSLSPILQSGSSQPGLLIQMGQTCLGVEVPEPTKLAQALLTLSAVHSDRPS